MLESVLFHKVIRHLGWQIYQKETQKEVFPLNTANFLETFMLKNIYKRLLLLYGWNQSPRYVLQEELSEKNLQNPQESNSSGVQFCTFIKTGLPCWWNFSLSRLLLHGIFDIFSILNLRIKYFVSLYFYAYISHWYCRNSVWSFRYFEFFMYSSQ